MKIKEGTKLQNRQTGKPLIVISKATGHHHWQCKVGKKKTHKIHEGTLRKFWAPAT